MFCSHLTWRPAFKCTALCGGMRRRMYWGACGGCGGFGGVRDSGGGWECGSGGGGLWGFRFTPYRDILHNLQGNPQESSRQWILGRWALTEARPALLPRRPLQPPSGHSPHHSSWFSRTRQTPTCALCALFGWVCALFGGSPLTPVEGVGVGCKTGGGGGRQNKGERGRMRALKAPPPLPGFTGGKPEALASREK